MGSCEAQKEAPDRLNLFNDLKIDRDSPDDACIYALSIYCGLFVLFSEICTTLSVWILMQDVVWGASVVCIMVCGGDGDS